MPFEFPIEFEPDTFSLETIRESYLDFGLAF